MPPRERVVAGAIAVAFLTAVGGLTVALPHTHQADPAVLVLLVAIYALAFRCPFEIGAGQAIAAQLAFIPMLFLAPLPSVPLLVTAGFLLGRAPDFILNQTHVDRWLHCFGHAAYTLGPVLVLGLLAPGPPATAHIPVYLLALAAQLTLGMIEAAGGDRLMYGTPVRQGLSAGGWSFAIDAMLTPVGYMVATAALHEPFLLVGVTPLFGLLWVFSQERKERYAAALELNQAYRGTVMVLADVVEADDNYTADHCRSVVDLSCAVAERLGLDVQARQDLEIVALLHDVGKIAIPNEIINKPSRLTDDEFTLMKTHTVEGQALLDRVGGRLARVGEMVRSCHERWDGTGYPDGLRDEEIPLPARVVFACDAYSAMTTDRPYRRAMQPEQAIEELRRNAGTQFEPRVVEALVDVVRAGEGQTSSYGDAVRAVMVANRPAATGLELSA
ncbi:MAG: hypothetical protein QOE08_1638 [Thermoleophilaceae bacterium]|jgi:HD-GYP domain-containing protein (c-di-GMP phosphodiesterase class II)|nr:hypothetical protein [Thermoleophilaceae bacterium]